MRKWSNPFADKQHSNCFYDLFDDWDLIESSFAQQYGIRLRKELDMSWAEFCSLLVGIMPETPLGSVVSIRAEKDRKVIRKFNTEQKRIYNEWRNRKPKAIDKSTYDHDMKMFEEMFRSMAKVGELNGSQ